MRTKHIHTYSQVGSYKEIFQEEIESGTVPALSAVKERTGLGTIQATDVLNKVILMFGFFDTLQRFSC